MNKLIEFIIAAFFFLIIYFGLVPLLGKFSVTFENLVGVTVIIIGIVFLLGEIFSFNWPWIKK